MSKTKKAKPTAAQLATRAELTADFERISIKDARRRALVRALYAYVHFACVRTKRRTPGGSILVAKTRTDRASDEGYFEATIEALLDLGVVRAPSAAQHALHRLANYAGVLKDITPDPSSVTLGMVRDKLEPHCEAFVSGERRIDD